MPAGGCTSGLERLVARYGHHMTLRSRNRRAIPVSA
jgi:hypothetical protein